MRDLGSIALLGSFTITPLEDHLTKSLETHALKASYQKTPYNQIIQSCINYQSTIESAVKTLIILWRIEDLMLDELQSFVADRNSSFDSIDEKLSMLHKALATISASNLYTIIVGIPPFPQVSYISSFDLQNQERLNEFNDYVQHNFRSKVKQLKNVNAVDLNLIQRHIGMRFVEDLRTWYLYKHPWTNVFWQKTAHELARLINAKYQPMIKCVALDCDGVLWGGIIGEDGLASIELGEDYPGRIFKEAQHFFLSLYKKGIFLALLSKNNKEDVLDVFDNHNDMILQIEHIAAYSINWEPKHQGIEKIAKKLNIGLDSIVFIDDSSKEIEEMQHFCPQVKTLLRPNNLLEYLESLTQLYLFDSLALTEEDQKRNELIKNETQRIQIKENLSYHDFLASLNLKLQVELAANQHVDRIVQLLTKTNQFNLTTRRYNKEQIYTFLNSDAYFIYVASAKDKFGDYGLIGVAIGTLKADEFMLDSFLFSCRALGRELETVFLNTILNNMHKRGARRIKAEFIPTAKNAQVLDFLNANGFKLSPDNWWCKLVSDQKLAHSKHVALADLS